MTAKLHESSSLAATGAKRRIRLISEGQGSSGFYSGAMLERDGASAFPMGTHIYLDHLTPTEDDERGGSHSVRDLVGVTLSDAQFAEGALGADAQFFSNWAPLIEEMREYIDLSIEAAGSVADGVVESLHPSPMNAVSVVPRGGRDGKILELIENFRESGKIENVKPDADEVREDARKDKGMTPEDKAELVEAITAAVTAGFATLTEALKPVAPVAVEENTESLDAVEVAEALVEAFPDSKTSRTRVAEAVKNGADVAEAIEAEKALVESVRTEIEERDDSVLHESHKNDFDYHVGGWNH